MNTFDLDARLRLLPLLSRTAFPPLPARELCDKARELYRWGAERRGLLAQLPDFDLAQFDALPNIAAALEASEAELAEEQSAHGPVVTRLCDEAVALRRRFVRAARYFLRHSPEALRQIEALSHERGIEAIAIDLGRICELATRHEIALGRALDLPKNLAATARRQACALCLHEERAAVRAVQARRNAIYWLLSAALDELGAALRYLEPEARAEGGRALDSERPLGTSLLFERQAAGLPALDWARAQRAERERARMH